MSNALINYSNTRRLVRSILGPTARVMRRGEGVSIVTERHTSEGRLCTVWGEGPDFLAAAQDAFGKPPDETPAPSENLVVSTDSNPIPTISPEATSE